MELGDKLESVGRLFYVVSPNRTTFETVYQVPNYMDSAIPDLFTLFLLEICISIFLRKPNIRVNDTIACLSQGIIFQIFRIFAPGGQLMTYYYIHSNWRIVNLPWDSLVTWWICFIGVDFVYYWVHRAAHGANRKCIDKNFGGTLIIWDKLFGSFAKETGGIVYGLTQPVNSFEPTHIQLDHCVHMWKMFGQCKGWRNKLSVLFKGPGWSPGNPRLGDPKDIPDVRFEKRKKDR